jgi:hypothetical protein
MFPTGTAGVALLVLRVLVAATLVDDAIGHWALSSFWILLGFAVPAMFLCVGFLTPYCSVMSCLMQIGVLIVSGDHKDLQLVNSVLESAILAVLGPGAYSIDARIFGRRLLTVPPRR